jgi:hypothetical protein
VASSINDSEPGRLGPADASARFRSGNERKGRR